jgi:hypothetical protein
MENNIIKILILLLMFSCNGQSQTKTKTNMITIEKIQEMYDNMHNNGVDTDIDMLYGYFFTNSEPEKLKQVASELKPKGFEFVDIYQDEEGTYWLHVERIENHNAKSLLELNKTLYEVADKFQISSYDGFDVGNADKTKAIDRDTYVVPEEFATNEFKENEIPYLVIANKGFENFPHKSEFYYFIKVSTKYNTDNWTKLPAENEMDILNDFEMFVENNLTQNGIKNYYIGRTTHNSNRIMYFVTNEKEGANGLLNYIKENGKQRDFDYDIIKDENWNLYNEIIEKTNRKQE